jgi:hypothetical protein
LRTRHNAKREVRADLTRSDSAYNAQRSGPDCVNIGAPRGDFMARPHSVRHEIGTQKRARRRALF